MARLALKAKEAVINNLKRVNSGITVNFGTGVSVKTTTKNKDLIASVLIEGIADAKEVSLEGTTNVDFLVA